MNPSPTHRSESALSVPDNDSSIPASEIKPVAHWESAHLYDHDLPAEHSLDLEWVISAQGEQPVAADGTHLPLDGNRYYGSHVALEVSEMKMTDVDGNYDVLRTVSSSFISPERALEVAWRLAEAAQACLDRDPLGAS